MEWKRTDWPFNSEMVSEIECHVKKIFRGKLYLWKRQTDLGYSYTISCGADSERSMTGYTQTNDLEQAKHIAESRPEVKQ